MVSRHGLTAGVGAKYAKIRNPAEWGDVESAGPVQAASWNGQAAYFSQTTRKQNKLFAAQAHSFRQQARLAISLSWIAGYTNALTLMACGQATSHVTGTTSHIGRTIAEARWAEAAYLLAVVVVFFAGALMSGLLTEWGRVRRWDSIYMLPMSVEAILLAVFALLVDWRALGGMDESVGRVWLTLVPAAAMGLQNATITRISGGVVRTTHVTGVITDIGIESASLVMHRLGYRARGESRGGAGTVLRVALLASIAGSFVLGAALGTAAWAWFPQWSMAPAVAFVIWIIWQDHRNPIASIHPHHDARALAETLPSGVAVYHIRSRTSGSGRHGRMPNLMAWADHLPHETRVVVLDLTQAQLDSTNAMLEIRSLAHKLAALRIGLILAGIGASHENLMQRVGLLQALQRERIVADLDDALRVARCLSESMH